MENGSQVGDWGGAAPILRVDSARRSLDFPWALEMQLRIRTGTSFGSAAARTGVRSASSAMRTTYSGTPIPALACRSSSTEANVNVMKQGWGWVVERLRFGIRTRSGARQAEAHKRRAAVGRVGLVLIGAGAIASSAGCQVPRDSIDVLLVGNSYIYFNNLPGMLEGISTALDGPIVRAVAHTHGGETLRGHVDSGHLSPILAETWDWVVLQEQSTLGAEYDRETGELGDPDAFHSATRELATMIRGAGMMPALYMTWAKEAFPHQTETLARAYRSIGEELDLPVAAVGDAWAAARTRRPGLALFLDDGSHPNATGSYLAACVLYAMMTGQSPVGAPRELVGTPWHFGGAVDSEAQTILASLPAEDARFLQAIAAEVTGTGADGPPPAGADRTP